MHWARDHFKNLVSADQVGMQSLGLVCPTCGEPVRRRAGTERTPHFAHYSHRAKPDCENYFPSFYPTSGSISSRIIRAPFPHQRSLSCGLFLMRNLGTDSWSLALRIPQLEDLKNGFLEIQSGLGTKALTHNQLNKRRLVRLSPKVPLAAISGTDDFSALAEHARTQIGAFSLSGNVFQGGDAAGRFIFPEEPLDWGTSYRIVSETPQHPSGKIVELLNWTTSGRLGSWHVFEAQLPKDPKTFPESATVELTDFFKRQIRPARPLLHVASPWPHHIDADGAYVYGEFPARLLLRSTLDGIVTVNAGENVRSFITVDTLPERWIEIKGLDLARQDVVISIDAHECILLTKAVHAFFQPLGVTVISGQFKWDLVSQPPISDDSLFNLPVNFECPTEKLANSLHQRNPKSRIEGNTLFFHEGTAKEFLAGGFGAILAPAKSVDTEISQSDLGRIASEETKARRILIERLVARMFGERWRSIAREFMDEPSNQNYQKLGPVSTGILMPYLRAATNFNFIEN
jgi:hypothetical protein